VRRAHPGYALEPVDNHFLDGAVYPADDDTTYATSIGGVDVLCSRRLWFDHPSRLPEHLLELAAGRQILLHGMHSVVDWLAFAVWEDGALVRSLSLSPGHGIMENLGEPLEFERPYWAGERPVLPVPGWDDEEPYPLPFHPLEMGEDALRALFGFVLEGLAQPTDVNACHVPMYGFRATDPTGEEQAARAASAARIRRQTGPARYYWYVDGVLVETDLS
jgi:hypothetical protein